MRKGVVHIPEQVIEARRSGKRVVFVQLNEKDQATWYWLMPDGAKVKHGTYI